MTLSVSTLTGNRLAEALPVLARLRMKVFRDYPYLYDGTLEYEEKYLLGLTGSKDSLIIVAQDDCRAVGCSTGSAFEGHHEEFAAPFRANGFDTAEIFYCGESVLLHAYRGRGLGHAFFDHREAHAKALGYRYSAFCSVIRPPDHPLKPLNYRSNEVFWRKRGYREVADVIAMFHWKEIGQPEETGHEMQFWMRKLD